MLTTSWYVLTTANIDPGITYKLKGLQSLIIRTSCNDIWVKLSWGIKIMIVCCKTCLLQILCLLLLQHAQGAADLHAHFPVRQEIVAYWVSDLPGIVKLQQQLIIYRLQRYIKKNLIPRALNKWSETEETIYWTRCFQLFTNISLLFVLSSSHNSSYSNVSEWASFHSMQ